MTKPKVVRVRAVDAYDSPCAGCLGCCYRPSDDERGGVPCVDATADGMRTVNWIFIHDTPEARAAYVALALEHGLQLDRS